MRSHFIRGFVALSLLISASANETITTGPSPEWVDDAPPFGKEAAADDGARRYHLLDYQYHAENKEAYQHIVASIINESGVESFAQLSFDYQPDYQKLTLHHITIQRNGEVLDRLSTARIETLRREQDMDRRLYDGELTALIILKDIQPGDVLSYSLTTKGENPVHKGHVHDFLRLGHSTPVDCVRRSIVWDHEKRQMQWKIHGKTAIKPKVEKLGNTTRLEWIHMDADALNPDSNVPSWHFRYPYLEYSDFKSWAEYAQWALPLYENREELPDEIKKLCASIRNEHSRDHDQVIAALNWVKKNIRYLGSFVGEHTHKPHKLSQICQRRFGDCKDKSMLTIAILKELGYDAAPALVHTNDTKAIRNYLPGTSAFNHLVVHLKIGGREYILDPTHTYQRGTLEGHSVDDYGYTFILRPGASELTPVKPRGISEARTKVREIYRVPDKYGGADLEVITVASGAEADSLRAHFAKNSHAQISENYLDFYSSDYEGIQSTKPIEYSDDEVANLITVREHYHIPTFWQHDPEDGTWSGQTNVSVLRSLLNFPEKRKRQDPLHHTHPLNIEQIIEVHMPEEWPFDVAPVKINHEAFKYSSKGEALEKGFIIRHEYQSLSDAVAPGQMESFIQAMDEVSGDLAWHFNHSDPIDGSATTDGGATNSTGLFIVSSATLLGLICGSLLAVAAWFWDPNPRPANPGSPSGISGWMILPTISALILPLLQFTYCGSYFMNLASMSEILSSEGDESNLWRTYYFIAPLLNSLAIPLAIVQIILLFTHRTSYPYFYISFVIYFIAINAITFLMETSLEDLESEADSTTLVRSILTLMIWGSYMLLSQRVRATFVKRRKQRPASPPPLPQAVTQ